MPVFIDLWYPGTASISAAITETEFGQTPWVSPDTTGVSGEDGTCIQGVTGQDEFTDPDGNIIQILSCTHMASNGMNEIEIAMFNPTSNSVDESLVNSVTGDVCSDDSPCLDNFRLLLRGNTAGSNAYNAWTFDQGDYLFYLGDGNDSSTLDEPATAHNVISVGSYVDRNSWPSEDGTETDTSTVGQISSFSGHGPTLDGRTGIAIVAPGDEIGSSLSTAASSDFTSDCPALTTTGCTSPDGNHVFVQGTSMASPHVASACAPSCAAADDRCRTGRIPARAVGKRQPVDERRRRDHVGSRQARGRPWCVERDCLERAAAGGNTIEITGVDLQPGVTMALGGQPLTLTNIGTNAWSAPVPPTSEAGAVSLTITNPDGSTASDPSAYVYLDPTGYHSLTPFRACDTRSASTTPANQCKGKTLGTRGTVTVQITGGAVPSGARAVVINLTALNHSSGATFVSAFPAGTAVPLASNLNLAGNSTQANLAIVQLSAGGAITLFNSVGDVDVIVDVEEYSRRPSGSGTVPESSTASRRYVSAIPARTRGPNARAPPTTRCKPVGGEMWCCLGCLLARRAAHRRYHPMEPQLRPYSTSPRLAGLPQPIFLWRRPTAVTSAPLDHLHPTLIQARVRPCQSGDRHARPSTRCLCVQRGGERRDHHRCGWLVRQWIREHSRHALQLDSPDAHL